VKPPKRWPRPSIKSVVSLVMDFVTSISYLMIFVSFLMCVIRRFKDMNCTKELEDVLIFIIIVF